LLLLLLLLLLPRGLWQELQHANQQGPTANTATLQQ
jgi:hypothetical protein